jgi:hypothetical protein
VARIDFNCFLPASQGAKQLGVILWVFQQAVAQQSWVKASRAQRHGFAV